MKNIIITSVINPPNTPLDYTNTRSVFSAEEREQQTINTINSIIKCLGYNINIIIVDCSIDQEKFGHEIKKHLRNNDLYINSWSEENKQIIFGENKGYGEILLIEEGLKHVKYDEEVFKISGRYYLDESFDFNTLESDCDFSCKARGFHHTNMAALTTFYKVRNKNIMSMYVNFAKEVFKRYKNISAETTLFLFLQQHRNLKIQNLDRIGVIGKIAVNGETHYN